MTRTISPPSAPWRVANELVAELHERSGTLTLRHWRGQWWEWQGPRWVEVEPRRVEQIAYHFTRDAVYLNAKGEGVDWSPNKKKVGDLLHALAAVCHLSRAVNQPRWLDDTDAGSIVSCANGLLEVATRELFPHSPSFFNMVAVPFAYDPDAAPPERWHRFLEELFDGDEEQPLLLQQFFGYVLSGRTDLQKIGLIVGPSRGGKGVITRTLTNLVGEDNVASPTLSSLGGEFGLQPLIGKVLATVSDARLGRDSMTVVERLLSLSGGDYLTINKKYQEQWTGRLDARFLVVSNELPALGDASAAIAGRFVTLMLTKSWFGKEDLTLEPALTGELPGILNWALAGLESLETDGRFARTQVSEQAFRTLIELSSPTRTFIGDRCAIRPDAVVKRDDLWSEWKRWCEDTGQRPGTTATLGKNLRAAVPSIRDTRVGPKGKQERCYVGIGLKSTPEYETHVYRDYPAFGDEESDDGSQGAGSEKAYRHGRSHGRQGYPTRSNVEGDGSQVAAGEELF